MRSCSCSLPPSACKNCPNNIEIDESKVYEHVFKTNLPEGGLMESKESLGYQKGYKEGVADTVKRVTRGLNHLLGKMDTLETVQHDTIGGKASKRSLNWVNKKSVKEMVDGINEIDLDYFSELDHFKEEK